MNIFPDAHAPAHMTRGSASWDHGLLTAAHIAAQTSACSLCGTAEGPCTPDGNHLERFGPAWRARIITSRQYAIAAEAADNGLVPSGQGSPVGIALLIVMAWQQAQARATTSSGSAAPAQGPSTMATEAVPPAALPDPPPSRVHVTLSPRGDGQPHRPRAAARTRLGGLISAARRAS